jgi:hypothetical protein
MIRWLLFASADEQIRSLSRMKSRKKLSKNGWVFPTHPQGEVGGAAELESARAFAAASKASETRRAYSRECRRSAPGAPPRASLPSPPPPPRSLPTSLPSPTAPPPDAPASPPASTSSPPDQEGHGRLVALPFGSSAEVCPVRSLRAWLDGAGVVEGAVFRPVDRHGKVRDARLAAAAVAFIVKRTAARIGLEAAGFATSAARADRPDRDIMRQTGHRSRAMLDRYVREAEVWRDNPAAGLL